MFGGKEEKDYKQRVIDFKRCFATEEGKRVLYYLMDRYHIVHSHEADPIKEGERRVVLEIMKLCNINLEQLDKMLKGDTNDFA